LKTLNRLKIISDEDLLKLTNFIRKITIKNYYSDYIYFPNLIDFKQLKEKYDIEKKNH
jgi:hypothetical protein